jgi:hypothetical protein
MTSHVVYRLVLVYDGTVTTLRSLHRKTAPCSQLPSHVFKCPHTMILLRGFLQEAVSSSQASFHTI